MKYTLFISLLFIFCAKLSVQAQDVKVSDLEIPVTPGFALLDASPTQIETNSFSKAFVINMLSDAIQNKGLPTNYGIIVTPFWFCSHKNMTASKFWGLNNRIHSPIRMTNLSVGSMAQIDALNRNTTNLSIGIKVPLLSIKDAAFFNQVTAVRKLYLQKLANMQIKVQTDMSYVGKTAVENAKTISDSTKNEQIAYSDTLEKYQAKPLFSLDFAAAANQVFIDKNYHNSAMSRLGAWTTAQLAAPIDRQNNYYLNASLLGRYMFDQTQFDSAQKRIQTQFLDAGAKIELQYQKLSLAYEAIYRYDLIADKSLFRHSGIVKYQVLENTYFTGSFGKNFGTTQNLIVFMGINFGILNDKETVLAQ